MDNNKDDFSDVMIPYVEFAENANERTPCILVLDCSGSMRGEPIKQLNTGLQALEKELKEDIDASSRVQLLVIKAYGKDDAEISADWVDAMNFTAPIMEASGLSPIGKAMELALIENLQRSDLNPIEEALGYQELMGTYEMTQEQAAGGRITRNMLSLIENDLSAPSMKTLEYLAADNYDGVILDIMMPKMDGWQVCREIRQNSKVPIIMLTAKSEERDELLGFDLGVDEYISKPFSPKILVARVEAILRRSGKTGEDDVLEAGGIRIDKAAHMASIDGKPMELSYKEFELLTYFLENQGIALSREKILNNVWNYDSYGDARTIDTHVKKLRSKMGDKGDLIKTIWGMGYKFEADES